MAQWLGQFSGHTHETLVTDYETYLRDMVNAFLALTSETERANRMPQLLKAAKRVHDVRVKCISARLAKARSKVLRAEDRSPPRLKEITSLEQHLDAIRQTNSEAILKEFGIQTD